jgi:hypothetical protein
MPYQPPVPGELPAAGTTADDAAEAAEIPYAFEAVTVNVYDDPFVNPVTVAVVAVPAFTLDPPGETVIL